MPHFTAEAEEMATGSSVGTFKTMLGIKMANTTGHRARLRALNVGPGGEGAQDINLTLRVSKTNNSTDGTSTAVTAKKKDPGSVASNAAAIGKNYSVEPTTVNSQHDYGNGFNSRATHIKEWSKEEAPVFGPNETLVVQMAPGAAAAVKVTITAEWEEF